MPEKYRDPVNLVDTLLEQNPKNTNLKRILNIAIKHREKRPLRKVTWTFPNVSSIRFNSDVLKNMGSYYIASWDPIHDNRYVVPIIECLFIDFVLQPKPMPIRDGRRSCGSGTKCSHCYPSGSKRQCNKKFFQEEIRYWKYL